MKKKRATNNYIILSVLLLLCFIFSFVSFRIPTTVDNFAGFVNGIYRGIDLNGGVSATYIVETSDAYEGNLDTARNEAINRVENLLGADFTEYYVEKVDDDKIKVTIPRLEESTTITSDYLVSYITFTTESVSDPEKFNPTFTGANITNAQFYSANGAFGTLIEFDDEGKEALKDMASNLSSTGTLYIYQDKDYSSTLLRISVDSESLTNIADSKQLFVSDVSLFQTRGDAETFANKIASGMLNIDMAQEGDIYMTSPALGEGFVTFALLSCVALIIASIIYLVLKYKELAIATVMSLLSFVAISVIIMPLISAIQFSLIGLISFMAIYVITLIAHIIYIEKAKQEFKEGKKLLASFKSSYVKSVVSNADMYVLTFLASLAITLICVGAIKTVALMCTILLIPSALTSMLIHRGLTKWYFDINPTKYKKINFEKGVTANEE